ncbi:MAG TPA: anti-sigma factor [Pyrinomonadaceae bacterium]|nr:anti-sigma factor [Pyrinomonadaceae bacterium]
MRHEDYKQLLALEAVGALDEEERARLEGHLPSCAECREELREMSDAAASLLYTVAPVRPSAELRANVLARVRAVDPSEVFVDPSEVAAPPKAVDPSEALGRAQAPAGPSDPRALLGRISLWKLFAWRPALGFGAAVAALAVVLLGLSTLSLWNRNRSLGNEVARLSDRLREAETDLAGQREQLAGARNVEELLASPAVRVAELSGKQPAPQAHAMLAYDGNTGRAVVMATGLPPCPEGHAYQLWLIADNKPLPGGTFKTDAQGRARMSDRLPPNHTAPTFAVTLEREGGVPKPEGDIFLIGAPKG